MSQRYAVIFEQAVNNAGTCSIRINGQWRICFAWRGGDAYDVEIVDYH